MHHELDTQRDLPPSQQLKPDKATVRKFESYDDQLALLVRVYLMPGLQLSRQNRHPELQHLAIP
jgi:hypothetical protein